LDIGSVARELYTLRHVSVSIFRHDPARFWSLACQAVGNPLRAPLPLALDVAPIYRWTVDMQGILHVVDLGRKAKRRPAMLIFGWAC
jgi:hypothetical protein